MQKYFLYFEWKVSLKLAWPVCMLLLEYCELSPYLRNGWPTILIYSALEKSALQEIYWSIYIKASASAKLLRQKLQIWQNSCFGTSLVKILVISDCTQIIITNEYCHFTSNFFQITAVTWGLQKVYWCKYQILVLSSEQVVSIAHIYIF